MVVAGSDDIVERDLLPLIHLLATATIMDGQLPTNLAFFSRFRQAFPAIVAPSVEVDAVAAQVEFATTYASEAFSGLDWFSATGAVVFNEIRLLYIGPYEDETRPAVGAFILIGFCRPDFN